MIFFQTLESNGNWVIRDDKGRMRSPPFESYGELFAYYQENQEKFNSDEEETIAA